MYVGVEENLFAVSDGKVWLYVFKMILYVVLGKLGNLKEECVAIFAETGEEWSFIEWGFLCPSKPHHSFSTLLITSLNYCRIHMLIGYLFKSVIDQSLLNLFQIPWLAVINFHIYYLPIKLFCLMLSF